MAIHPTALIDADAVIDPSVTIGPFTIIEKDVHIGADCVIESHVRIYRATRLGCHNRVGQGVTLGTAPQDLQYHHVGQDRPLVIGDRNQFREQVTISKGFKTEAGTVIGNDNYFMANAHVGHDCNIGHHNIFANAALLSGHVNIADHNFLSGHVAVHQFCRISSYCMIGGLSGITQHVPPFVLVNGQRARIIGLNTIGLRRNGFNASRRQHISQIYNVLLRSGLPLLTAMEQVEQHWPSWESAQILAFIRSCAPAKQGVMRFAKTL
jgi:UDP-N-acetylglucosamine acyltransferase